MLALVPPVLSAFLTPQSGLIYPGGNWEVTYNFPGSQDHFGTAIANIGDVDKDGFPELAVSEPGPFLGASAYGNILVFSTGTGGILYSTSTVSGVIGNDIVPMGDLDGDTYPDFMASAPYHEKLSGEDGLVHIYSGRNGGILREHIGSGPQDLLGFNIANLQDLNGDGVAEYSITSLFEQRPPDKYGVVRVYDGSTGNEIHEIVNPSGVRQTFGSFVASLGDYDLDGVPDFGVLHTWTTILIYSGRTGQLLTSLTDPEWSLQGKFINAGDLDKDGFDDLAIGSLNNPLTTGIRARFRVYSVRTGETLLSVIAPRQEKLGFGTGLTKIGDVNRDGVQDFLIGNILDSWDWVGTPEVGAAYVFSGRDGEMLARFEGMLDYSWYGQDCELLGDLDDDGLPEIAISSPFGDFGGGIVHVWSLKPYITANRYKISAQLGGRIDFEIDFPQSEATQSYAILASTERLGSFDLYGLEVPIPETWLTRFMLSGGRPAGFINAKGRLDFTGDADATYTAAPGDLLPLIGQYLSLSVISFTPPTGVREASIPAWIYIHP